MFLFPYTAGTQAARNEEALFLHHLRGSSEWHRVVPAIALHRGRLEARDVQDAIARGLSSSIFQRSLAALLWDRLVLTAGVEEDYASPPWEVRNGQCVVKGTNETSQADANGGPVTKYAALFDTRAVFDTLRVPFLRIACGPRLVRLEKLSESISPARSRRMRRARRRYWAISTGAASTSIQLER